MSVIQNLSDEDIKQRFNEIKEKEKKQKLNEYHSNYYKQNREKLKVYHNEKQKEYYNKNKEALSQKQKEYYHLKKYGNLDKMRVKV